MALPEEPRRNQTLALLRTNDPQQRGVWLAYSAPSRDELGTMRPIGYYEGAFSEVLDAVLLVHRRAFVDDPVCGDLVLIEPHVIGTLGWRNEFEQGVWQSTFAAAWANPALALTCISNAVRREFCAKEARAAVEAVRQLARVTI